MPEDQKQPRPRRRTGVRHLGVNHLVAIAIRLALAIEVEPFLVGADRRTKAAQKDFTCEVRLHADKVLNKGSGTCGEWFANLAQFVASYPFPEDLAPESVNALLDARARLEARLLRLSAECGGGSDIEVEHCMPEVLDLVDWAETEIRALYGRYTERLPEEFLAFSTERTDKATIDNMWENFHVSGATELATKAFDDTLLRVYFRDRSFDWTSLCQLQYVIVHELTCHAFQGLEGPDPRSNAEDACTWSEGWMDAAAWSIVETWIRTNPATLPGWFRCNLPRAEQHCRNFHQRRYLPPQSNLRQEDIFDRESACSAFGQMQAVWPAISPATASRDSATEFSLRLNLCSLSYEVRRQITDYLSVALLAYDDAPARVRRAVRACEAFAVHRDPIRLDAALHDACLGRDLPVPT